jgi:hypothetical protein
MRKMGYKQVAAAKNVLQFGLPQLDSAGTKETDQTVSHHQVEFAVTLLVTFALAFGEELVVEED